MTENCLISLKNVSKEVKIKREEKIIVDNIDLQVNKGEIVGYIGPNGAGKSTTIKMMCGIIEPTRGQILINGIDPFRNREKNGYNIGVVFGQRTQLWWDLPLKDSFEVLRQIYNIDKRVFVERLEYLSELFDIKKLFKSTVRTLSLGERMKADLVAAVLHNPKLLFLDEPTIGLDFVSKRNMRAAIVELNKTYHTTIILTTHDFSDIEELCSRIVVLDKGKIIYDGTMDELNLNYRTDRILETSDRKKLMKYSGISEDKIIQTASGNAAVIFDKETEFLNRYVKNVLNEGDSIDFTIKDLPIELTIERILNT